MSDSLAVRLRSEHATTTEQLMDAKLIDSLVDENEVMRVALEAIANGTVDIRPPFRAMPREHMQTIARAAICGNQTTDEELAGNGMGLR